MNAKSVLQQNQKLTRAAKTASILSDLTTGTRAAAADLLN